MKIKKLRHKRWFRIATNRYVLILTAFLIWMLFLDSNSWLVHRELNSAIEELNDNKKYYSSEIAKDEVILKKLNDSIKLEKFARQEYFMKRPNEEIYVIEYEEGAE